MNFNGYCAAGAEAGAGGRSARARQRRENERAARSAADLARSAPLRALAPRCLSPTDDAGREEPAIKARLAGCARTAFVSQCRF